MLSFNSYIALSNINLIHKCLHDRAPQVLCDLVQLMQDVGRSTRSAAAGNCRVPHRKTSFGQSSFLIKGVNIRNSLPNKLKAIQSWVVQEQN